MPEMDGLETVWRIRVFEAQQQHNCSCQDAVVPPSALRDQRDPGSSTPHTRLSSQSDCLSGHGGCERCKATPVWAVSASSLQEQSKSPAMQLMSPSHRGRGGRLPLNIDVHPCSDLQRHKFASDIQEFRKKIMET